ncbi:RecQ-mediated genome instability protein 1 [Striga hermonthica]|uniref:RecQ-mediated genome instability protein 1 n=1 Tax=Striga hermonthica TaxID=68872 RepID=A0A9N7RKT3_STRHE|nr:RecQ-mediated genome instability protein 1 [Striga hermonthica]
MSRRRLRVVCSSDEEDEEPKPPSPPPPPPPQQHHYENVEDIIIDDIDTDFQTVTINSSNPTPSSNYSTTNRNDVRIEEPIPIDISDEEGENVVISGATNDSSFHSGRSTGQFATSESPVNAVLENLGLRMKKEWLDSCLRSLQSSVTGFQRMDDLAKAKLCFEQFLRSDMNYSGAGVLPRDVHTLHLVDLKGPFVLQVDEIVNISRPIRGRYQSSVPGSMRCLKLSMTDGVQRVFGMEYRPINSLQVLAPAGLKVVVCNVNIRHGLLMLVPEVLEVLGGSVEEMEAARQRLVTEINKPPRGKRNRSGVVPPLATRATLAAWPPLNNDVPGHVERNSSMNTRPRQANTQGASANLSARETHVQASGPREASNYSRPNSSSAQDQNEVPRRTDMPAHILICLLSCPTGTAFSMPCNDRPGHGFGVPTRSNLEPRSLPEVHPVERVTISHNINEATTDDMSPSRESRQVTPPSNPASYTSGEDVNASVSRHNDEPKELSCLPMDVEEIRILDELEHHFMLSRNKDIPFTYLATLSAECAALEDEASVVRGKIKCFLTAVKGFRYRQATYELRIHIDDGSLINEILVDHCTIQKKIGYSPQDVISAIDSSDIEQEIAMKEKLLKFQQFLANFEGTMLVEMSKKWPLPVAVEMNQGCSASDACLLLKRLKSTSPRSQSTSRSNPIINLSP